MSGPEGTPGQTVGPFFGYALPYPGGDTLVPPGRDGAIRLAGRVVDGAGAGVPDALVEVWQAGPTGAVVREPGSLRRDGWSFTGWGRAATDPTGAYSFTTLRPAPAVAGGPAWFAVAVVARGLLDRLLTRVYLPDDPDALAGDRLLSSLPDGRRSTLIARPGPDGYRFDVVLQGDRETVFLQHRPGHPG
ncbi:protocatechuate 3,4-dioxygenase subunit alpha [Acidiferrimicrobium sp. IK]|uniref:protocatechuate 3,4-dioxygenase subunit alpha n=1 Tax=Acidiferrimicrobium sp. IK TaxID=2871700 RepID=UPI0021CB1B2B|nr:protocatechuate 3,4-dioxygenase subunit alpha [Acidiferrimicrobium sp. IK]MCU4186767.1 protocatechuate 3,4-dioxygenase subunit alpha [Acidiferrimicrobium sp. IK]